MGRLPAPISDYVTDTKSVLDQSLRILQAMTDVSADAGWLDTALVTMMLVQSLMQVSLRLTMVTGAWCPYRAKGYLFEGLSFYTPTPHRPSWGTLLTASCPSGYALLCICPRLCLGSMLCLSPLSLPYASTCACAFALAASVPLARAEVTCHRHRWRNA